MKQAAEELSRFFEEREAINHMQEVAVGVEEAYEARFGKAQQQVQVQQAPQPRPGAQAKQPPVAFVFEYECSMCELLEMYEPYKQLLEWFFDNELPVVTPMELLQNYRYLAEKCMVYTQFLDAASGSVNPDVLWQRWANPFMTPPNVKVTIVTPMIATVEGPIFFFNLRIPKKILARTEVPPLAAGLASAAPMHPFEELLANIKSMVDKQTYTTIAKEVRRIHQRVVQICEKYGWPLKRRELRVRISARLAEWQQVQVGAGAAGRRRRRGGFFGLPAF